VVQVGDGRPSYDELAALVVEQARVIAELRERVAVLEAENAELKRRLGMNSTNSSKPPSSDSPFAKPAPRSLRGRSGRKPGGQPGHPGSTLTLVADPNERRRHEPGSCTGCGADLAAAPEVGVERRQVFDVPPMTVQVTEHQLITRRCECGTTTCGAAPEGVSAPTAGWYTEAPTPGERGPAVLAAHVDWNHEKGVFYDLRELKPGDEVTADRKDGISATFRVARVAQCPKDKFPTEEVYGDVEGPQLRLITCGGDFNPDAKSYRDNIVVYADLMKAA
jgi:hypothetical protein